MIFYILHENQTLNFGTSNNLQNVKCFEAYSADDNKQRDWTLSLYFEVI